MQRIINIQDENLTKLQREIRKINRAQTIINSAPIIGKFEVRKLIEKIAGGDRELTVKQLNRWRDLIMHAVKSMRDCYESPDIPKGYPVRLYYQSCWERIKAAETDKEMTEALEYLRMSIKME